MKRWKLRAELHELLREARIFRRLDLLESYMSAVDDIVTALNTATDEIAADLQALRDEVAGSDQATAAKFEPLVQRLQALGADPQNPVPDDGTGGSTDPGTGTGDTSGF
jgi:hypothetical protein